MWSLIAVIVFGMWHNACEGTHPVLIGSLPRNESRMVVRKRETEREGKRATTIDKATNSNVRNIAQSYFPESIPQFPVRRDVLTHEEVHRGNLIDKLYGRNNTSLTTIPTLFDDLFTMVEPPVGNNPRLWNLVSSDEMRARFQCAPNEPGLSAAFNLIELAPPSIESLEWTCAYAGITLLCTLSHHSSSFSFILLLIHPSSHSSFFSFILCPPSHHSHLLLLHHHSFLPPFLRRDTL